MERIDKQAVLHCTNYGIRIYSHILRECFPEDEVVMRLSGRDCFLDNLPPEFDRKTYLAVAEKLKIPAKTAEKYISKFCVGGLLKHLAHDSYGKP